MFQILLAKAQVFFQLLLAGRWTARTGVVCGLAWGGIDDVQVWVVLVHPPVTTV